MRSSQPPGIDDITVMAWEVSRYLPKKSQMRKLTNGDGIAIMLLAAQRMGVEVANTNDASTQLEGVTLNPITLAAMEKESCRVNDIVRQRPEMIAKANLHVEILRCEYGFSEEISREAFLLLQEEAESIELDNARGQDVPTHRARLDQVGRVMDASQWTLHPDYGCVLKTEIAVRDRASTQ